MRQTLYQTIKSGFDFDSMVLSCDTDTLQVEVKSDDFDWDSKMASEDFDFSDYRHDQSLQIDRTKKQMLKMKDGKNWWI